MPDLLLELFSEEIPARMQAKAADDLRKMVTDKLVAEGLVYEGAKAFVTPRRLALTVHGIPARQPDLKQERKGPKVGAADAAVQGFLKAAGLKSLDEAKIQRDPKGDFYIALMEKAGRPAIDVIAEIIPLIIRTFPWPKQMRWGERSARNGALTWVRPLHSIIATFGPETEEPEIVKFDVAGIEAGQTTYGHRFMAPAPIEVRRFDDYVSKLEAAKVVLDPERRKNIILEDAKEMAFAQGFELVEDQVLLDEVAGLVEWPVVLMGSFDEEFLSIPGEVIRATIRNNQKCFVVRDPSLPPPLRGRVGEGGEQQDPMRDGPPPLTPPRKGEGRRLAPKFILTANVEATDGGKAIVAGNERVIRARLSDAKFFYETDLKTKLEDRLPKFAQIVFHEKLGTQAERIARIEKLAAELAPLVGADVAKTKRAAQLAKADLLTEVVGEFPEVQGLMGRYYALAQGEDASVAAAIEDHYKPQGPADRVPTDPVAIAVALADKLDILTGFWSIDEKPTGSKDPFALRRAALGVIRLVIDNKLRLSLSNLIATALMPFIRVATLIEPAGNQVKISLSAAGEELAFRMVGISRPITEEKIEPFRLEFVSNYKRQFADRLLAFFADRLKAQLRDQGARHDLVDAVFALEGQDDLLTIVRRVEALGLFLDTDDGKNLLAGIKRAANILRIEEKKDSRKFVGVPDEGAMNSIERHLWGTIQSTIADSSLHVANEDFQLAMESLSTLRSSVDAFFDKNSGILINDSNSSIRENRLKLLTQIREAARAVADFSRIQDAVNLDPVSQKATATVGRSEP